MARRVRVTTSHSARAGVPLRLTAGQEVTVGRRDDEWPAWVWCETADGNSGWVPEAYLAREAPEFDRASALHDYDATELNAAEGAVLEVVAEEGGWLRCRTDDGHTGWIPERDVEPM